MTDQPEEDHSTRDDIRQRMTDDDRAQWDVIQEWKAAQVNPRSPRVITQRIRSYVLTPVKKWLASWAKSPAGLRLQAGSHRLSWGLSRRRHQPPNPRFDANEL